MIPQLENKNNESALKSMPLFVRPVLSNNISNILLVVILIEICSASFNTLLLLNKADIQVYLAIINYCIFFFAALIYRKRFQKLLVDKYFILIIIFLFNCACVDLISATLLFGQPALGMLRDIVLFGGLFLYPILFLTADRIFIKKIINGILIIGTLGIALAIFVSIYQGLAELIIVPNFIFDRFDRFRITLIAAEAIHFTFFYSFVNIVIFKKYKYIFLFLPALYSIYYISMTRQVIVSFSATILLFMIIHLRAQGFIKYLIITIAALTFLVIVNPKSLTVIQQSIISLVDTRADDYKSVSTRKDALAFYFDQFEKSGYIGFGKISTIYGKRNAIQEALDVENGGRFFIVDLGLLGSFTQYGFVLLFIVFIFIINAFKDLCFILKYCRPCDYPIVMTIELVLFAEVFRLGPFFTFTFSAFHFIFYFFLLRFYRGSLTCNRSKT